MNISTHPKAVVIGKPISHSKSPLIHTYWLKNNGLQGQYDRLELQPDDLANFVLDLRAQKYVGANVTLPYKTQILSLCDHLSATAQALGAVNTLYLREGNVYGDNTDAYGFLANLDKNASNWDQYNDSAIILGAGGAARAVLYALIQRKFKSIIVLNRTLKNAQNIAHHFYKPTSSTKLTADIITNFPTYAPNANIVINASSIGLNGSKFENLDLSLLPAATLVHDIVYTPLQTPLLLDAKRLGLQTLDGLGMLLHQAVPGFEYWFGIRPEVTNQLRQKIVDTL